MKTALRLLVFSIVSLATWMVTSSIVAQQQQRRAAAPLNLEATAKSELSQTQAAMGSMVSGRITQAKPGEAVRPIELGMSGAFAEAHLRSQSIIIEDGVATATAHVSLADRRPGMSYVWRLRVVDPQGIALAGTLYDNQMFTVDANGQKEVDFQDVVAVPPGAKRVELVLYAKSPSEDLSFLDDTVKARAHQRVRAVKLLTN